MNKKDEVLHEIKNIMIELFGSSDEKINFTTSQKDIEEWDSLGHLRLFMTIEQNLGINFVMKEIASIKTVEDIVDFILKKNGETE